jgi:hypothetical protein
VFALGARIIRMCFIDGCEVIYLDNDETTLYVKPCKTCGLTTGFFNNLEHFYKYIDLYGIDTDKILDTALKSHICEKYNV